MPEVTTSTEYPDFLRDASKNLITQTQDTFNNVRDNIISGGRTPTQFVGRTPNQLLADQIALNSANRAVQGGIGQNTNAMAQKLASQPLLTSHELLGAGITPATSSDLSSAIQQVAGGWTPDLSENSSALQGAISAAVNPIQRRLQEQLLPQIGSAAVQGGAFGGARQDVLEGQALRDFSQEALDLAGQITFQDLAQRRDLGTNIYNNQSGLAAENLANADRLKLADVNARRSLLPQLAAIDNARASTVANLEGQGFQNSLLPAQAIDAVGTAERGENRERQAEAARQFQEEINLPFFGTDILLRTLAGTPTGTTTTQSSSGGLLSGSAGGVIGGGLLGALAGSENSPFREFIGELPFIGQNPVLGGAFGGGALGGLLGFLG